MQAEDVVRLDAGDWRDAAGKGWLATRNTIAALALELTGVSNPHNTSNNAGLRKLTRERGANGCGCRKAIRMSYTICTVKRFMGVSIMMIFPIWCTAWPIIFAVPRNWPGSWVGEKDAENQSDIQ